jgi:hypothetical protein
MFLVNAPDAQKLQIDPGMKYDMIKDTGFWIATTDLNIIEGHHYYTITVKFSF